MIKQYSSFISDLVRSITSGREFTWNEFGFLMKDSGILALLLFSMTIGLYLLFYKIPVFSYVKTVGKQKIALNTAFENGFSETVSELNKKIRTGNVLFTVLMITVYIPLVLPVLLMIINVLF